jgi:hypothetical protein
MRRKAFLITLVVVPLALLAAALIVPCISVDSVPKMREAVLRNDVFEMRALISQYTLDLHRRPQSIDEPRHGRISQTRTDRPIHWT